MTDLRTSRSTIHFDAPFALPSLDIVLPAGYYDVDTEERFIGGIDHRAYLRVATLLHVRSTGKVEIFTVDPIELQAALKNDGAPAIEISSSHRA